LQRLSHSSLTNPKHRAAGHKTDLKTITLTLASLMMNIPPRYCVPNAHHDPVQELRRSDHSSVYVRSPLTRQPEAFVRRHNSDDRIVRQGSFDEESQRWFTSHFCLDDEEERDETNGSAPVSSLKEKEAPRGKKDEGATSSCPAKPTRCTNKKEKVAAESSTKPGDHALPQISLHSALRQHHAERVKLRRKHREAIATRGSRHRNTTNSIKAKNRVRADGDARTKFLPSAEECVERKRILPSFSSQGRAITKLRRRPREVPLSAGLRRDVRERIQLIETSVAP